MNILILSAFPQEQNYYSKHFEFETEIKIGFIKVTRCQLGKRTLHFATTGMGTINAAVVVTTLAAQLKPSVIFFSGTAGGIDPHLKIGDVVMATQTFDADMFTLHDKVIGTPFEPALINPNNLLTTPRFFKSNMQLEINNNHNNSFSIFRGTIATSNHFPTPQFLFEQLKQHNALAIDMESAAIYQYAWLSNIPCLAIRGISNIIDNNGNDENIAQSDISAADHAAALLISILDMCCIK